MCLSLDMDTISCPCLGRKCPRLGSACPYLGSATYEPILVIISCFFLLKKLFFPVTPLGVGNLTNLGHHHGFPIVISKNLKVLLASTKPRPKPSGFNCNTENTSVSLENIWHNKKNL